MYRLGRSSGFRPYLLAGLALVLLTPGLARAEMLQVKNETPTAVLVQAACVVRGVLVRDRPYLLNPNEKSPAINLPGNKVITICDAKVPTRVLFQGVVPATADDQLYSIQADGARLKLEKQRAKPAGRP